MQHLPNPDSALDFMYTYLDRLVISNKSYNKIFEIRDVDRYIYILSQNNKKTAFENLWNPYFTEISITRVSEHIYFERQAYWKTGKRNEGSDTWEIDSERSSLED